LGHFTSGEILVHLASVVKDPEDGEMQDEYTLHPWAVSEIFLPSSVPMLGPNCLSPKPLSVSPGLFWEHGATQDPSIPFAFWPGPLFSFFFSLIVISPERILLWIKRNRQPKMVEALLPPLLRIVSSTRWHLRFGCFRRSLKHARLPPARGR
jgi:hypothetical protein